MSFESEVVGKEGIVARVVQASKSAYTGKELWTFELEFPRFILAEVNTHCMLEKNSASSRAIPVNTSNKLIQENPAMPVYWGKNQAGMVAVEELGDVEKEASKQVWLAAMQSAVAHSLVLDSLKNHKQVANRVVEPWQRMKTVMSGTEWENLFYLRDHPDADPTFQELAKVMKEAKSKVEPTVICNNEWHVPYVERKRIDGVMRYFSAGQELTVEQARMVSASCAAQTSYRRNDETLEKAIQVFKRLNIGSPDQPAHASPTTHQGTPISYDGIIETDPDTWPEGVTHMTKNRKLWSGKFQDFVQFRKLIPNEARW